MFNYYLIEPIQTFGANHGRRSGEHPSVYLFRPTRVEIHRQPRNRAGCRDGAGDVAEAAPRARGPQLSIPGGAGNGADYRDGHGTDSRAQWQVCVLLRQDG